MSSTTPVAWTDQTALGSPEATFSPFAGTCQAPFRWDGSAWSGSGPWGLDVVPVQGESTLTATVILDPSSARFVTQTPATPAMCPNLLAVDGTVTLDLPEGKVADQRPVTITASAALVPTGLSFSLKEEDFGPWVSIRKSDPASSLAMSIDVTALARGCSGQVTLSSQRVSNGEGSGAGGPLAAWSDTGFGAR